MPLVKEVLRHLLRRPVVGIAAAARSEDGRWLLVRRRDTMQWALPGGTLNWGETLRDAIRRELAEETGAPVLALGELSGVYSAPDFDERFHAVTIVVHARVGHPSEPENPLEIAEARLFSEDSLPQTLCYGMGRMLEDARNGFKNWA